MIERPSVTNPIARFEASVGSFEVEVFLDRMPLTAKNFLTLAENGFYNGLHIHRVVRDFMVLFGCPYSRDPADSRVGSGGPPNGNIPDEFLESARISNLAGTLAMANKGTPNSGGSQFFFNLTDSPYLDWFANGPTQHAVFAHVIEGFDVVLAMGAVAVDGGNRPVHPIRVERVVIRR